MSDLRMFVLSTGMNLVAEVDEEKGTDSTFELVDAVMVMVSPMEGGRIQRQCVAYCSQSKTSRVTLYKNNIILSHPVDDEAVKQDYSTALQIASKHKLPVEKNLIVSIAKKLIL